MDSWTAANVASMYTCSAREKFTAAWAPVPVLGHVVGHLGLPAILLLSLCIASVAQFHDFCDKGRQLNDRVEAWSGPCSDLHEAAKRRWKVWIYVSHLSDVPWIC